LRPRRAAIADATDSLELHAMFAQAILAADPVTSGVVYYVDAHFVPCAGAKPVGKGWNNKRGRGEGTRRHPRDPPMTGGRRALGSRPGWPSRCRRRWPS
jgi:hypothetical protein